MEMANSIEGRVPFLDHKLVEVMRSQPITQKIRGAAQKFILREAARSFITDTVYRRPKHPFLSPPATLDPHGRLGVFMQDTLRSPVLSAMPFFDKQKVVAVLDTMYTGDENARVANDQILMMVLSACVLQDRYRLTA
jgi:asparagine synthase (glutamine-hydrolysing)